MTVAIARKASWKTESTGLNEKRKTPIEVAVASRALSTSHASVPADISETVTQCHIAAHVLWRRSSVQGMFHRHACSLIQKVGKRLRKRK